MKNLQSGCIMAAFLSCLVSFQAVRADETGEESDPGAAKYKTLTKDQYESEVIKLETWKSNVQGTHMGDKLMRYLTTLDANLVRNHRDAHSLYKRGYLYGTVGCTRAAIADLSKAIELDPMSSNLYCERGICYMDMGEYSRALSDLNSAVSCNPYSGDAHLARGRLQLILERADLALPDLLACKEQRMEFSPALPDEVPANFYNAPDYYLGVCYDMLGEHEKAITHYQESAKEVTGADSGYIHRYADRPQGKSI